MDLCMIKFRWLNIKFWRISQAFTDHLWISWHDSQNTKVLEKAMKHSITLWILNSDKLVYESQVCPVTLCKPFKLQSCNFPICKMELSWYYVTIRIFICLLYEILKSSSNCYIYILIYNIRVYIYTLLLN